MVVVAAGQSRRMSGVDKTFVPLLGLPLIAHTVELFESSALVEAVVVVLPPTKVDLGQALAKERGWRKATPDRVCAGGARRQDSVRIGLERIHRCDWVAVHDGARPCMEFEMLERGLEAARETGAAVAAVPARDTIKLVSGEGTVESTPPRDTLWMVQTPQVFRYDLLLQAHRSWNKTVTDDASIMEGLGRKVKVFLGSYTNIKVTNPEDLAVAELYLNSRNKLPTLGGSPLRSS